MFKDYSINLDFPWDVTKDNDDLVNPSMSVTKDNEFTTINISMADSETTLSRSEVISKLKDISSRYPNIKRVELYGDYATNKVRKNSLLIVGLDIEDEYLFQNSEYYKFKYDILKEINKNVETYKYKEVIKDKYLGSKGLVIK